VVFSADFVHLLTVFFHF